MIKTVLISKKFCKQYLFEFCSEVLKFVECIGVTVAVCEFSLYEL